MSLRPAPKWLTERTVDEIECVASVLLAIWFAHLLGATNVAWAAFSGFVVIRGHFAETLTRGVLRMVGTVAGAGLALVITPLVLGHVLLVALALLLVGTLSLYYAITARRAYAWLLFGLTFVMIVLDKIDKPQVVLTHFAATRVAETLAGTVACVAVSLASAATLRRIWPAARPAAPTGAGWHPLALRHAAQGGTALVLLLAISSWLSLPALVQAAITIMAVMLVPVSAVGEGKVSMVSRRIWQRFVGCVGGAALAAVVLLCAQGAPAVLIAGTALGVALGRHLETGAQSRRYVGMQFTLAILVTLVPDSYANADIHPGLERLSGILIGMAILEPVLIGWHLIAPLRPSEARAEAGASPAGVDSE